MKKYSRRNFIRKTLLSGAGILSTGSISAFLDCAPTCPKKVPAPNRFKRVLADLHVHPMLNDWINRSPLAVGLTQQVPVINEIIMKEMNETGITWKSSHQAGIDMICVAHFDPFDEFLSMPTDPNPDAVRRTMWMMDILERDLKANQQYTTLVRNRQELIKLISIDKEKDWENFRIAVVHTLEGGHALGGDLESLTEFARRGVAMIGITHFFTKVIATSANSIPYFPDNNSQWVKQGLSEFGEEVVKRMEELGIIVDVSHGTAKTIDDVLRVVKKPIVSSHSAVRALGDHGYSLFDEHVQQIARDGGIVGVILMPYWLSNFSDVDIAKKIGSLNDVVRTIRYLYKICGHRHENIGIGTDFAGYIPAPNDMKCHGEIERLRHKLTVEFDHDEQIVEDIMANNVLNFFKQNWKSGL